MKKELCVLVLGIGGNVGQGILKALSVSGLSYRVIGACISPLAYGLYTTHRSYVSPYYNDPNFFDWIVRTCHTEKVDVILSGVEQVLSFLSENAEKIQEQTNAICIVSPPEVLAIAQDKFLTSQWLENQGFNFPKYAASKDPQAVRRLVRQCGYPLIGKPRFGRGGSGIVKIVDANSLNFVCKQDDYVVQEYIGTNQLEYTVGCFSDKNGKVCGSIVMKRELLEGTTFRAEVVDYPAIQAEAERIVAALKPTGPCNLQFRVSAEGKPVCFEINMRFSGTTPVRARFGFNEVKAALEHFVLGQEDIVFPVVKKGIALRYWNEIYIDGDAYEELNSKKVLNNPKQFELLVEDYGVK